MNNNIHVTRPYLPPFEEYSHVLKAVWDSHILSNDGALHERLKQHLAIKLGVKELSLVNNGTMALQMALLAIVPNGKVITTPYSFVATANSILLSGLDAVFVDIEDEGFNIDPELIEVAYSPSVKAVMPVHVYGIPCDVDGINLATRIKGMSVIYDAAHAFGVKLNGVSVLNHGAASILSFHATKVFHTFEGGAIVTNDNALNDRLEKFKNFGFDKGNIDLCGTNGKLNEAQAAMGLVLLNHIDNIQALRKKWHELYVEQLKDVPSINPISIPDNVEHNYSYFPIRIQQDFPLTRDELFDKFTEQNIYPRKYFYPLITDFSLYKGYKIISKHKIPNARKVADSVICLPLYPDLTESDVTRVCDVIHRSFMKSTN